MPTTEPQEPQNPNQPSDNPTEENTDREEKE